MIQVLPILFAEKINMSELQRIQRFVKGKKKKEKRPVKINGPFSDTDLLKAIERVGKGKPISEPFYKDRKEDSDPSTTLFWNRFGSFNNAVEMIYGKQMKDNLQYDELYFVKLIQESGIKSKKQYLEKREKFPDLFPAPALVLKLFGEFKTMFLAAENFDIRTQLLLCLQVKMQIGKPPKLEDYKKAGVNVQLLLRKFVLLSEINKRVRLLEEGYEIKRRNFTQTDEDVGKCIERETQKVFKPFSEQLLV